MTAFVEPGIVGRAPDLLVPFYVEALGFVVHRRIEFAEGELVKLRRGDAAIKIFFPGATPDPTPDAEPYWTLAGWRYAALCFDDHDEMHRVLGRVREAGGRVVMEPRAHRPGAEAALVTDPEGNHWELLWEAG